MRLQGRRVAVLGLARSGEAAARALLGRGASVRVLDAADGRAQRERAGALPGVDATLGRVEATDVEDAELIVTSPGVPPSSPWLKAAEAAGIPVWSEIELAFRLGVSPAVAITGTNGKTTTTEMLTAVLLAAGRRAVAAGNVGVPLVGLADAGAEAIVCEVSSFQLHSIDRFRAPVAVVLNVARDHLDWHGSFDAYAAAKARLFENQREGDTAVFHDDAICRSLVAGPAERIPFDEHRLPDAGAGVAGGWIVVPQGRVVPVEQLGAPGRPHRADAVAAAAAAASIGVSPDVIGGALAAYRPRPHRIEVIAEINGVTFINDSKATDPHAVLAALEELDRVVLIAGGRNKGLDLGELADAAPRLRAVVAMGEAAGEVEAAFEGTGLRVERAVSMDEAVEAARGMAEPGDTVLLSPACASFDMFDGYEARGEAFRAAVTTRGEGNA